MTDPGQWTDDDHLMYAKGLLRRVWRWKTSRDIRKMRRRDPLLVAAIEGILKYDRS